MISVWMKRFLAALALLAWPTVASAEDTLCRNGLFADADTFAQATVLGEGRAYFHEDLDGCPWEGDCRTRSYVIPGDTVILSDIRNGFACAFYPSKGGGTAGWIRQDQLRMQRAAFNPPIERWTGDWSSEGNPEVTISTRDGSLFIEGEAYWPGPPETVDRPSVNIGAVEGPLRRTGNRATYADDNLCELRLTLLADFLLISDNRQCGGMNVTFSSVYQRAD